MKKITSDEFDQKFDNGESIIDYLDQPSIKKINETPVRISVDFPKWMIQTLDKESNHLGISRQALIKLSVAEHINQKV
jgi:hypothetical protein